MKVRVSRSSSYENTVPCNGAVIAPFIRQYTRGDTKIIEEGHAYYMHINNLSDLFTFIAQNGRIVMGCDNDGTYTIEIYDDYRE